MTRRRTALIFAVAAVIAAATATSASATTGAEALSKPPIFNVTAAKAKPFLGTYRMVKHPQALISSTIKTAYNGYGYLQGNISLYTYYQGQPASMIATLYEYRYRSGAMRTDLWTPDVGSARLGRLTLHRAGRNLRGTLTYGGHVYPVTYAPAPAGEVDTAYQHAGTQEGAEPSGSTSGLFSTAVTIADVVG